MTLEDRLTQIENALIAVGLLEPEQIPARIPSDEELLADLRKGDGTSITNAVALAIRTGQRLPFTKVKKPKPVNPQPNRCILRGPSWANPALQPATRASENSPTKRSLRPRKRKDKREGSHERICSLSCKIQPGKATRDDSSDDRWASTR